MVSNKERIDLISKQLEDYETYNKIFALQSHEGASKELEDCKKELDALEKKYSVNGFLPNREFSDKLRTFEASAAEAKELSSKAAQRLAEAEADMNPQKCDWLSLFGNEAQAYSVTTLRIFPISTSTCFSRDS